MNTFQCPTPGCRSLLQVRVPETGVPHFTCDECLYVSDLPEPEGGWVPLSGLGFEALDGSG